MTITAATSTPHTAADGQPSADDDELVEEILAQRQILVASNRGPITFMERDNGDFSARQGSGGLVTAISAVLQGQQAIWIAAAMTDGDRARAKAAVDADETLITPDTPGNRFRLRYVVPSPEAYHQYYNVISNPLLWFLQHYLWDTPRSPDITRETWQAWRDGYVAVNQQFADEVVVAASACEDEPIIMLQDYQLYLCGGMVREQRPNAIIQHFVHIPWPYPDYWRLLPLAIRRAICEGLLGCDIVGFQGDDHARSFMTTCEAYVPDCRIDYENRCLSWRDRTIQVRSYPISIDTEAVRRTAYSQEARTYERYLPQHGNEYTILRVDRAEPSKNIVRGFAAFDRLLEAHPEYRDRVNFIAVTQPSRLDVEEYREYLDNVSAKVGQVNAKYANTETGWHPIHLIMGESYPRVLAAMKWYDVMLCNSIIDGMHLGAKEAALINERNGVLILSEGAGAAQQLGEHALVVAPADVEGTAEALYQALTMPQPERQRRAAALRAAVEEQDVTLWFRQQLVDIARQVMGDGDDAEDCAGDEADNGANGHG